MATEGAVYRRLKGQLEADRQDRDSGQSRAHRTNPARVPLLGGEPVRADADVDLERRIELVGGAHLAPHQLDRASISSGGPSNSSSSWIWRTRRVSPLLGQSRLTAHHRHLDDVGGGALDHGVDREALMPGGWCSAGSSAARGSAGGGRAAWSRSPPRSPARPPVAEGAYRREALEVA